jgi:putative transposase
LAVFKIGGFMKKSRFTESQIGTILKEAEGGIATNEMLRSHGISAATFYKWRSKFGGLEASEQKRVKELELQLSEYKTMVAELTRDNRAFKNLIEKSPSANG